MEWLSGRGSTAYFPPKLTINISTIPKYIVSAGIFIVIVYLLLPTMTIIIQVISSSRALGWTVYF